MPHKAKTKTPERGLFLLPSPKLIITVLHDTVYMEQLKEQLNEIKRFYKSSELRRAAETVN